MSFIALTCRVSKDPVTSTGGRGQAPLGPVRQARQELSGNTRDKSQELSGNTRDVTISTFAHLLYTS